MRTRELTVAGAFAVLPEVHEDVRGSFAEWFRADRFEEAAGHGFALAQANCSVSARGTLRGVHFSQVPPGQGKYVSCLHGAVHDVVVDLRPGSPTYGRWDAVRLDAANRTAVHVPVGVGHGFLALEDASVVAYLCDAPYTPEREHGVDAFDAELAIDWPQLRDGEGRRLPPLRSDKDAAAPSLEQVRGAGLLSDYDTCLGRDEGRR